MLVILRKQWKLFPVTIVLVAISVALYVASLLLQIASWMPWTFAWLVCRTALPALTLPWATAAAPYLDRPGMTFVDATQQLGALNLVDFWAGDIAQVVVSGFHHGFFLHILGNVLVVYYLGAVMEMRVSRWWYAAFSVVAVFITILSETFWVQPAVGTSGLGYALFGFLMIARYRDFELKRRFPRRLIIVGLFSIAVCFPITWMGWVPVANTAHITGLIYGLIAGAVFIAPRRRRAVTAFVLAHVIILPAACALAMKPTWSDDYIEYLAATAVDREEQVRCWQLLVDRNPANVRYRTNLMLAQYLARRPEAAWRTALAGLRDAEQERTRREFAKDIRDFWSELTSREARRKADSDLESILGDRASAIRQKLDLEWLSVRAEFGEQEKDVEETADELRTLANEPRADEKQELTEDPDNAALGRRG